MDRGPGFIKSFVFIFDLERKCPLQYYTRRSDPNEWSWSEMWIVYSDLIVINNYNFKFNNFSDKIELKWELENYSLNGRHNNNSEAKQRNGNAVSSYIFGNRTHINWISNKTIMLLKMVVKYLHLASSFVDL